ncbi:MAG: hydroxymethylbilane synthase [Thaumarchaeota archaeon]|nr:hydroxymethylbilane synthase [Candidatus Geocrenenecus arthurdayi]
MRLRVGTRGSKLSLIQTMEVTDKLKTLFPELEYEIKIIKTRGDIDLETPLYMIPEKGIFEKEIDQALIRGEIDFAVHSMKDYPTKLPSELVIAAVPERRSPYDVFISRDGLSLDDLPRISKVGTSSLRREAFIKYVRSDLEVIPIRGNVETRIQKMLRGDVDALILAEAGLERIGGNIRYEKLPIEDFTPPAGQGALAVVARKDNHELIKILENVNHYESWVETMIERGIISLLNVGCKTPIGVYVEMDSGELNITISTVSTDYSRKVHVQTFTKDTDISKAATDAVRLFKEKGGLEILNAWKRIYDISSR